MAVILLYLGIVDLILMFQDFESAFSVLGLGLGFYRREQAGAYLGR